MLPEKKYDALGLNVLEKGQHIVFLLLFHIQAIKHLEKFLPQTKCLPHELEVLPSLYTTNYTYILV